MPSGESKAIVNSNSEKDELDTLSVKKKVAPRNRYLPARDSSEDCLDESEALLYRRQRAQCIPMSPLQSPSEQSAGQTTNQVFLQNNYSKSGCNKSLSLNDSPELQSIKPANSRNNVSEGCLRAAQSSTSISSPMKICSLHFCCGANPLKISFLVLAIVTLWSTIIFCINIQKQVSIQKTGLGVLQNEILKLKHQNNELRKDNTLISSVLGKIASSAMRSRERNHSSPTSASFSPTGPSDKKKGMKQKKKKKGQKMVDESAHNKICTSSGQSCIFPFVYKDVVHRSCVKEWSYPRPWCATKVDGDGRYISGDSSGWSECLDSCP